MPAKKQVSISSDTVVDDKKAPAKVVAAKKEVAKPVEPPVVVAKPVVAKEIAKATEPKVAKAPKEAKVVVAVVPPTVVEGEETKDETDNVVASVMEKVNLLSSQFKIFQLSLKTFIKEYEKQRKVIDKVQKKREKAKKSPSGFAKPCKISDTLCDFIGVEHGTEKSRTEITRFINNYVKEHNLNNPSNRREFFPDAKLNSILNVKDNEKVTYFVLQRLISHHFPLSMAKQALK